MPIELLPLVLMCAAIAWVGVRAVRASRPGRAVACRSCEHVGPGRRHTRGHILIEIILWLCFLVPGLIYTIWRLTTRADVCAVCGSHDVIPADTPAGRRIAERSSA